MFNSLDSSPKALMGQPEPSPLTGILVDCKRFDPRGRKVTPPRAAAVKRRPVPVAAPAPSPPGTKGRSARHGNYWRLPAAMLGVGLLFLAVLTLSSLYLCQASAQASSETGLATAPVNILSIEEKPAPLSLKPVPAEPVLPVPQIPDPEPEANVEKKAENPEKPAAPPVAAETPETIQPDLFQPLEIGGGQPLPAAVDSDFCGTEVAFVASPKLASVQAIEQHKLLFVLHVSGNFEDPGFT